ncbi:MAG: zinc dependent phospholipase C family protein, partial [Gemmatimonadales bacterium]
YDLAPSDPVRAFALGYLSHLAADCVAHNFFVPRQLVLTSTSTALGHSYWESRFETHLGDGYARTAKEVILMDHTRNDEHLDGIISPTIFSVRTNRRIFRGLVHLTETQSWQRAFQLVAANSRWDLPDSDVDAHMALSFDFVMGELTGAGGGEPGAARRLDPSGEQALLMAKRMRRQALAAGARGEPERLAAAAREHFGLPGGGDDLRYWPGAAAQKPWWDRRLKTAG